MATAIEPLTESEKEQFCAKGWLKLSNCFAKEQADWVMKDLWTRLGMDPDDKSTWRHWTNMPHHRSFDCAEFAPKAWAAICELCGGEDRLTSESRLWRDSLIVNLGSPELEGESEGEGEGEGKGNATGTKFCSSPTQLEGWHVDGDFFVHYLDSPEQGLLVVPLFTDVVPGGGGTVICPEAIAAVARHLRDNPDGVSPRMVPRAHPDFAAEGSLEWFNRLACSCGGGDDGDVFVEAYGTVGDVYLLHPLMLHSALRNTLRWLRVITNPPVSLVEPHRFYRADGSEYSLVEQATLRALGVELLPGWGITAAREGVVLERVRV